MKVSTLQTLVRSITVLPQCVELATKTPQPGMTTIAPLAF